MKKVFIILGIIVLFGTAAFFLFSDTSEEQVQNEEEKNTPISTHKIPEESNHNTKIEPEVFIPPQTGIRGY